MSALILRYGNPAALPIDILLSAIPSLPRATLDRLTQELIDRLDAMDGDPDLESDGDEMDTANAEDELFVGKAWGMGGPGCPISDQDKGAEEDGEREESL